MGGGGGGGPGGCERRIEVFGKIHKKKIGGRGGGSVAEGVRLGGGGQVGGVGLVGGSGWMSVSSLFLYNTFQNITFAKLQSTKFKKGQ